MRPSNDHDIVVLQVELLVVHLIERLAVEFSVGNREWVHLLHYASALGALAEVEGAVADNQYILILRRPADRRVQRQNTTGSFASMDVDEQLARWESVRQLVAYVREVIEQVLVLRSLTLVALVAYRTPSAIARAARSPTAGTTCPD